MSKPMDKIEALRLIEEVRRETRQPKVLKVCDELERVMLERPVPGNTSTQPVDKLSTRRHSVDKPVDKPVQKPSLFFSAVDGSQTRVFATRKSVLKRGCFLNDGGDQCE
jgi:hypothetical protein